MIRRAEAIRALQDARRVNSLHRQVRFARTVGSDMTSNDLITYLTRREEQHRERAVRAVRADTITLHQDLAVTFHRLIQEAQVQVEPMIDDIASAPRYLKW